MSYWSRTLAFCLHGASQDDVDIYVMINAYWESLQFGIHEGQTGQWKRVVDTALPRPDDFAEPGCEPVVTEQYHTVRGRSVVVLVAG